MRSGRRGKPGDRLRSGLDPSKPTAEDERLLRQDVRAEIDAHFEGTVELLERRGWSREDATAEVRRRFGDVSRYEAQLQHLGRRRMRRRRGRDAMDALRSHVRFALRSLRRAPGLSATISATLALGIGANATLFSVADRLLLSPPEHVAEPGEVRLLYKILDREAGDARTSAIFTYVEVAALRSAGLGPDVGAAMVGMPETLGEDEGAVRVRVGRADRGFLPLVGVHPILGRGFAPDDHEPGAPPVALLGHALWTRRFGGDPSVVGRTIRLGEGRYDVVGVLPPGFTGARPPAIDVWLPLEPEAERIWGPGWKASSSIRAFGVLARLSPADREESFAAGARAALRRARTADGVEGELLRIETTSLVPGDAPDAGSIISISRWLAGVSLLVLLVACANVTNLFLAWGERSRRETAVRRALGAGRARLGAELLVRSLLLGLLGAAGALVLTAAGWAFLEDLFLAGMELSGPPRTGRIAAFTAAVAVAAALVSGLVPALLASRVEPRAGLDASARGGTGGARLRGALVALQATLSTLLLVGAGLFLLSFRAAADSDLGFAPERLAAFRLERQENADVPVSELYARAEASVRTLPGVASASRTVAIPFVLLYGLSARLPGTEPSAPDEGRVQVNGVGPDYFETMGVPLLRGRAIQASDLLVGAPAVVVVGRTAAARLWPGVDPLGGCLIVGSEPAACARVVGVADDHRGAAFRLDPLSAEPPIMAWVPVTLPPVQAPAALMVRVRAGSPADAIRRARRHLLALPSVRYVEALRMSDVTRGLLGSWRLGATVFSLFGLIALGVAAVGLHGFLAYDVARRRSEIGVRIALGAPRARLAAHVAGRVVRTVGVGLGVGLLLSLWGAAGLRPLLFADAAGEFAVFAAAGGVLLAIVALAAVGPAWRAMRIDPRESLAAE